MTSRRLGRPPHKQKPVVRSYYLPLALADAFRQFVEGKVSRHAAAALVTLMAIPLKYHAQLAEAALNLPPAEAVKAAKALLPAILDEMLIEQHLRDLSPDERMKIVQIQRSKLPKPSK